MPINKNSDFYLTIAVENLFGRFATSQISSNAAIGEVIHFPTSSHAQGAYYPVIDLVTAKTIALIDADLAAQMRRYGAELHVYNLWKQHLSRSMPSGSPTDFIEAQLARLADIKATADAFDLDLDKVLKDD